MIPEDSQGQCVYGDHLHTLGQAGWLTRPGGPAQLITGRRESEA